MNEAYNHMVDMKQPSSDRAHEVENTHWSNGVKQKGLTSLFGDDDSHNVPDTAWPVDHKDDGSQEDNNVAQESGSENGDKPPAEVWDDHVKNGA